MRSDKNKKKNLKKNSETFMRAWAVVYLIITVSFFAVLTYMNLLPMKYLLAGAGILLLILLLTFPAMYFRNFKKSRKVISLVLSILLMGIYGFGAVYMMGTLDFFSKITQIGAITEEYYVIAEKNSKYEDIEDIKGQIVQTYLSKEIGYAEGKNLLKDEADTEYEMKDSLSELAGGLLKKEYPLIFISEAHYDAICSEVKNFEEKTKIIYTVTVKRERQTSAKNVDVTREPFNVFVSGLDTDGTIDTVSRSDVNMIVTVNPNTHKVTLTSLPRDAYISLPGKDNAMDKLTHTGLYGVEASIGAVEKLMGIEINYYAKVNYTTVEQLVDAIGGIDVHSDYTFSTHGMGVYYDFYEGENHLDGSMALAFARERKSFPDGDFQRNRNQQIVLEAVLKKALSSTTILTKYTSILHSVEDCVELNMSRKDMQKLIKMQLDGMPSWEIEKQSVLGVPGSELCYSTGDFYCSVVYADEESLVEAVEKIVQTMSENKKENK